MANQFQRTSMLFGKEAMLKFKNSKVAIIGLGGVGGYAAEILVRSGIGSLMLIDFDKVGLTNLNRQLIALHSTIGLQKTDVLKDRLMDINPQLNLEVHNTFLSLENRDEILVNVDFAIDAIDSLGPKVGLLEYLYNKKIPVISSMGAGNKIDPSKIAISDISESWNCPLAKRVRKFLRRRGIANGIPVVYSHEKTDFDPHTEKDESEDVIMYRGRERVTVGSVGYMPAIMGMWAASYILRELAKKPNDPPLAPAHCPLPTDYPSV